MAQVLLRLEGITKSYGKRIAGGPRTEVLKGIDLALERGESLAVVGPSGSGKSTLLSIAGTLEPPTSGRVLFEDRDVAELSGDALARFRNEAIGFVFQQHHLLPQLTALENVLLPTLAFPTGDGSALEERAQALLARVGLGPRASHRPAELSGGERQRVAVVRALINEPRLVLADEPTGSLDQSSADELGDLFAELGAESGLTLLVVTHSQRLAERMGRVARLENGRLDRSSASAPAP